MFEETEAWDRNPFSFSWRTGFFKRHRILVDGEALTCESKGLFSEYKETLSLTSLDPREVIITSYEYRFLVPSLLFVLLGGFWLYLAGPGDSDKDSLTARIVLGSIASLMIIAGFFLLDKFLHVSGSFYLIRFRQTGQTALVIAKKRFIEEDVAHLRQLIAQHSIKSASRNDSVADQLDQIVSLYEEGHLTMEEFKAAKGKVLGKDWPTDWFTE